MSESEYLYSEIFYSMQGEGNHTGKLCAWLRFFKCNLQCDGFGQPDPSDRNSYTLPYKEIDVSQYTEIEQLPVFSRGCDSSYSWSKKFKHLQRRGTPTEISQRIRDAIVTEYNPHGKFNPDEHRGIHMCFTGGEPLLTKSQLCSIDVLETFEHDGDVPPSCTYETNGTRELNERFVEYWKEAPQELFFSVSPKLFNVTGELNSKAIKPDILSQYYDLSNEGQLKFVMSTDPKAWDELEDVVELFRKAGCHYPVWIMPVSATVEGQYDTALPVTEEAMKRGYHVSARVHTYIFGNAIGT